MTDLPFKLLIKPASSQKQHEVLTCAELLRNIDGRRQVYQAVWENQSVIAKIFSHKICARRHLKREWNGLIQLQKRLLNSPKPLFYGQTENGCWVAVTEKIPDTKTALQVFNETKDSTEKLDLLLLICGELAEQHKKGVLQRDLHLGNFLLSSRKVFTIDPGQTSFSENQIGRKKSISQLALLAGALPRDKTDSLAELAEHYADIREWNFEKGDYILLRKKLAAHTKTGLRKGLKKTLRTSKRYLKITGPNFHAVFAKTFCENTEPLHFIEQIDAMMDKGLILKNGNTCYLSRVKCDDKLVVIKRYNPKGLIHSLRHTIKRSRARRAWLCAHMLTMLNINTPPPLAYIEKYKTMLLTKSYMVTEFVDGQKLGDFLDSNINDSQRQKINDQLTELLNSLAEHRVTHGDLKHSNVLVTEKGPVLTDLDAMTAHKSKSLFNIKHKKDHKRLKQNLK